MTKHRIFNIIILFLLVFSLVAQGSGKVSAMPSNPTDETKVPHYFGPNPNWANSPTTLPDVTVEIVDTRGPGFGSGATASAAIDAAGAITAITVVTPGSGYDPASTQVNITGSGTLATADAVVSTSGVVTSIQVDAGGAGYTAPVVAISGGGPVSIPASAIANLPGVYSVTVGNANGGTFTLSDGVLTTGAIAWNALAADVDLALTTAGIVPTAPVTGSGSIADPWLVTVDPLVTLTIDGQLLVNPSPVSATAHALGGVDAVIISDPGTGYTFPTVDFDLPDDPNGVQASAHAVCVEVNCAPLVDGGTVTITEIVVDNPGSGYSKAPNVVIHDGTLFDPVVHPDPGLWTQATASTTLAVSSVVLDTFGSGYVSAPTVDITDSSGTGSGAAATAFTNFGGVTGINVTAPGSGYITPGGIKKFQDGLPQLCIPATGQTFADCVDNNLGQHIPVAVPDTTTFPGTDYYVIGVVQHRERMSSSLPVEGTLLREYVQLETPENASFSKHVALANANLDPAVPPTPVLINGVQAFAVDDPHFLGPVIVANKDKAVRIVFYNLLPTGVDGNLFLPTDSTIMGSGMGPMAGMTDPVDAGSVMDEVRNPTCTDNPQAVDGMGMGVCFAQNRATLHLHGGNTPWISDGTAHQWITPAGENTPWPEGVSVENVPDMVGASKPANVPDCSLANSGCQTFYYTNQQSARLLFYHDHSWGITRLNVYAGEAAGYVITDPIEQKLIAPGGAMAGLGTGIPLVIQDRTFVPQDTQLYNTYNADGSVKTYGQDPTWDNARWGGYGNLWYHHVYMPAQNPGDPGGMSAYGRWMYGPWFWPPATPPHGPIDNPYFDPNCNLDDPATWTYQTDPFCEPAQIPGTPNISVGMEQFNDTPLVNGTAYPTTNLDPKTYRFRILNAANDRFWNLQWYVADPRTGTDSEVALNPAEVAAAQTDPVVFPTPDLTWSPAGPSWIQIGSEGGFLPAPVVVPNQPTTWITDPTRFDVGNVDQHSLLLAPAERADVIVDFSRFAGKTLILYNDAPAAFPARVPSYDYYTGYPDQSPNGPAAILPGYGPNTRTIMQVKIAATQPAPAFNLSALNAAFRHHADGSGVFESGQHPIIVGQAAYNSAYGKSFAASGNCTNVLPSATTPAKCDGLLRINQQGGDLFTFNTLRLNANGSYAKVGVQIAPKAIHDEMNSTAFDEFGRMTANLGVEAVPATPAAQNVTLYPFTNPATELIDATNLPKYGINVSPISVGTDGTQIWKITHNGVDTHPIHWHLYDVQVINRVTWDNIIIPTDPAELGWKDTVRISPLQDTIVALRPIMPQVPFELPNNIRLLNPMMPEGSGLMFHNVDPNGNPTTPVTNILTNFGWEYTYHCHILSHEEMDMMRPVSVALPPNQVDGLVWSISGTGNNTRLTLTWNDNSINETGFLVQRTNPQGIWTNLGIDPSPLDQPNTRGGTRTYIDTTFKKDANVYQYRVVAQNTVGYTGAGGEFPKLTVQSTSAPVSVIAAPTNLTATLVAGSQVNLSWMDNATNESGYYIERAINGGLWASIATTAARNNTGIATYADNVSSLTAGDVLTYRVTAFRTGAGQSAYSNVAGPVTVPLAPAAPSGFTAVPGTDGPGSARGVLLNWTDNSNNETGFTVQRSTNATFTANLASVNLAANTVTLSQTGLTRSTTYFYRIRSNLGLGSSVWVTASVTTRP